MELRGQFELLHTTMLIDNGVLVLGPSEGQKLVVMVDGKLRAIISEILDDFLVRRLLGLRVWTLQVGIAVVLLQRRMLVVSLKGVGLVLGVPLVGVRVVDGMTTPRPAWMLRGTDCGMVME